MMRFFQSVNTLEELKKEYKRLAKKLHPDMGGSEKDFIELKDEYDRMFAQLQQNGKENNSEYVSDDNYKDIIDSLIIYDFLEIEIIGTWCWVTGETKPIKEKLKELGFRWAKKKGAWYHHQQNGYKKRGKKDFSMDDIRNMHGVQKVKSGSRKYALKA